MKRRDDPLFEMVFDGAETASARLTPAEAQELRQLEALCAELKALAASAPEPSDLTIAKERLRESLLNQGLKRRNPWFARFAALSAVSGCAAMIFAVAMMSRPDSPDTARPVAYSLETFSASPVAESVAPPVVDAAAMAAEATPEPPKSKPKQKLSPPPKVEERTALVASKGLMLESVPNSMHGDALVSDPDPGIVVIGAVTDSIAGMQIAVEVRQEANELIGG